MVAPHDGGRARGPVRRSSARICQDAAIFLGVEYSEVSVGMLKVFLVAVEPPLENRQQGMRQ
jgi:hypothetical protein